MPFKFLTVYLADFRRHHATVYGADVVAELPDRDFEAEVPARVERIERLAADDGDRDRTLRIIAGETARLRALLDGAESIGKSDVLDALAAHDRTDAHRVYRAYVDDESEALSTVFLRKFVDEQTDEIRAEIGET